MNVSRLIYGNLWNFAQTSGNLAASGSLKSSGQFGPGDGSTTFSLPDLRGLVVRSWDDGKGIDPTRAFGSFQDMAVQSHSHSLSLNSHSHTASTPDHSHTIDVSTSDPGHQHAITYLQYGFGYADFRAGSGGTIVRMNSHSESAVGGGTDVRGTGISVSASARGASTPISVSAESVSGSIGNTGEAETRMKNVALLACIKF
jgi:microcystin-dependent protein